MWHFFTSSSEAFDDGTAELEREGGLRGIWTCDWVAGAVGSTHCVGF